MNLTKSELSLVSGIFLFQDMDDFVVEGIISDPRCQRQCYTRNEIIFDETNYQSSLGVILSGDVLVEKAGSDGKRIKISTLSLGDCFGAAAMFQDRDRYATILTAISVVEILFIPEALIRWSMKRDLRITENYIRYLSGRIAFLTDKISALTAGTVEQKLAIYLLEHSEINMSMTGLSKLLNIGRASLYRALDAFEGAEIIHRNGKQIVVTQRDRLERFAAGQITLE